MKPVDFASLLEALPDAVVVADMSSRIVYANASVESMLGWPSTELVGRSLHALQPDRLHAAHDKGFGRYARTGVKTLFDTPIRLPARTAGGGEREIELTLAELGGSGDERLVVGVLRDAGDRVDLERHLAILRYLRATTAARARLWNRLDPLLALQTLTDVLVEDFDAALARTWVHDEATGTLRMQTSAGLSTRVSGSSREIIDIATHPYKVGVVARTRQPFVRNGLAGDPAFEQDWVDREGIESVVALPLLAGRRLLGVVVAFFRHAIRDEVAETIGLLAAQSAASVNDARLVAREREARAAADRARDHFRLLAAVDAHLVTSLAAETTVRGVAETVVPELADWAVVDVLSEGNTVRAVARAHRDPGRVEQIEALRQRYPPHARAPRPHAIYRAISDSRTVWETVSDDELASRAVDDEHLALLRELGIGSHVVVPLTARGRVVGAVSFVRGPGRETFDESDVQTAEEIGSRTALALDNARLYRSAEEAVALRDQFLAIASHELRTPLSVVRGHWELVSRRLGAVSIDDLGRREQIDTSMRRLGAGIEQLQRLVDDLLDVNRTGGRTMELHLSQMDLATLARDVVEGLPDEAARRRVRVDVPAQPVVGYWDRARVAQVVSNLVTNAVKYSPPEGEIVLAVSEIGPIARIAVQDSGIGIAEDQLDAIFEPFVRAPNATSQHYPGLGLGLAVSREIVIRLGGRMWAESAGEGHGATFVAELPLVAGAGPIEGEDRRG